VIVFLIVGSLDRESFLYLFFFRSWYVQGVTTWLFGAALAFVILRFRWLKQEKRVLERKIAPERLTTITPDSAAALLEAIPSKYRDSISFRRIGELLRGYLHGEEVVHLNQQISSRDVEQVETGHLVLNALRQLIPILGFLGTVVGLSRGMMQFPDITRTGASIDSLRAVLRDFAASLSVAFDTTLLALSYSVVVVLLATILRHKEEAFVAEIDQIARILISKLSPTTRQQVSQGESPAQWQREVLLLLRQIADAVHRNGQRLTEKLEELRNAGLVLPG